MKNNKYIFPAVFEFGNEEIGVYFPDLDGCITGGSTELEAFQLAQEVLALHLLGMEEDGETIPTPTSLFDLDLQANERAVIVEVYMTAVRMSNKNKSVNRTVTLPAWLNEKGLEHGVNFSQLLQEALMEKLV